MTSLPHLQSSIPSPPNPDKSKLTNPIPSSFARIPSWVSLKPSSSSSSSIHTHQNSNGHLEGLHLLSLSKQGRFCEAREFLRSMDSSRIPIKTHLYQSLFGDCGAQRSLDDARFFHHHLLNSNGGKNPDGPLGDSLIKMYAECLALDAARNVFDAMPNRSLASWSIMIYSFARNGYFEEAVVLFSKMRLVGVSPDAIVLASMLQACSNHSELRLGRQMHSYATRTGLVSDSAVGMAIVDMYVKCRSLESSALTLDQIAEKSVATWTSLMVGYTRAGRQSETLTLFDRMMREGVELDQFVFSVVLKACAGLENWDLGRQIHCCVVKLGMDSDVSVGTPVVDFYVKSGNVDSARDAFDRIYQPNEVSWSSIITGYAQQGFFEECFNMFKYLRSNDKVLNSNIYTSLFQVSSALADLNSGSQLHADAIKRGLVSELYGKSALVTMYSRSGKLDYARRAFILIADPDTVAWTAIIAGCAYHGQASEALELFNKMRSCGVRANSITLIGALTGCSHAGLVSEATQLFNSMSKDHGVEPTIDHYNCMVDVYCRAGRLEEAFALIKSGFFEPDAMSWKILLGGCISHKNTEIGKISGENLLRMEPGDVAAYVLTFNMYATAGRWDEAASVRKMMNERGIRKEVSCSWITVQGKVHRFIVGDKHHELTDMIYSKLDELESSILLAQSMVPRNDSLNDLHEERMEQVLDHSERLAIAFGLISASNGCPISIFKNLRVCNDCHAFTKLVSTVTGRAIIVRDSTRFHHFENGACSCNDYW